MSRALLLIDFEEEWRTKSSEYNLGDFSRQLGNARKLLEACRRSGIRAIYTRHVEPGSTTAFAPGSPRVDIISDVKPLESEKVFEKNKISPFYKTDLESFLGREGINDIIVCGIMTNLCVRSAVADAYDRDMTIVVAADACVSDSAATDRFTFEDIRKTRPEVRILKVSELLREITR